MSGISLHRSFFTFLIFMLFAHAVFMVVQLRDQIPSVTWSPTEVIKLRLQHADSKAQNQIVQSEDSAVPEKTENAFLSDKDRKFERQTVAKTVDSFKQAAKGNAQITNPSPHKVAQQKKGQIKDLKLSDVGIAAGDPMPKEIMRGPASESIKGLENGDPLSQGLSATNDYVEEVALGDFTHLNTVEYKFYGFFHRIRLKLEQFWGKSIREKADQLFRSGRRLPASENLITSLQITLNARGEIVGVKILGTSGVKELDDAAIESFNQAGPFPNPPSELLVNGKAVIEWGFVVKS